MCATYTYRFANGEAREIEVSEGEYLMLADEDMREFRNNRANTRRHISLDRASEELCMQLNGPEAVEEHFGAEDLQAAIAQLRPEQQYLIRAIFFEGVTLTDLARQQGVSQPAITKRLRKALLTLGKFLNEGL